MAMYMSYAWGLNIKTITIKRLSSNICDQSILHTSDPGCVERCGLPESIHCSAPSFLTDIVECIM